MASHHTHHVALSTREVHLVLAALTCVTPVGGGSELNTLLQRLQYATDELAPSELLLPMCNTVIEGARECGAL